MKKKTVQLRSSIRQRLRTSIGVRGEVWPCGQRARERSAINDRICPKLHLSESEMRSRLPVSSLEESKATEVVSDHKASKGETACH